MGEFKTPFNINCPKCETHISGVVNFDDFRIDLENASLVSEYENKNKWCIELSAEFPTRKFYKKTSAINLTPYIQSSIHFSDSNSVPKAMKFALYNNKGYMIELLKLYNLFWNKKHDYLFTKLEQFCKEYQPYMYIQKINNRTDAAMALHQLLITTTGISYILGKDELKRYSDLARDIIDTKNKEAIKEYINYIKEDIDKIEKQALNIIKEFGDIYYQFIPVASLLIDNSYENINQENYGITTANYEQLTNLYAKSYEWILDNINLIIGLNNIYHRGNFKDCIQDKNYQEHVEKIRSKYKKMEMFINFDEHFSLPMDNIDNIQRNAIQHFSKSIDYRNQIIHFEDNYGGRTRNLNISLMDFAKLCIENIKLILYILEIIYTFRKMELVENKIYATTTKEINKFLNSKDPVKSNKIGRNTLCPCGSNIKYKKCCGIKS